MLKDPKPLYRKVNTTAHNVSHKHGSDAGMDRNTKSGLKQSMKKDVQRGLDYTPLYRFLLSKTGKLWNEIYSEAVRRLDKPDALWHIVTKPGELAASYYRVGESSYYSGLYINDEGLLQLTDPELKNEDLKPSCKCCTHTFNGEVFKNEYIG